MTLGTGRGSGRDLAGAAGLAVLAIIGALTAPPGRIPPDAVAFALLVLGSLALAYRGRAPVWVLGIATACLLVYEVRGYPGVIPAVPVMAALYTAVRGGHRRPAGIAIGLVLVGCFVGEKVFADDQQTASYALQGWILLIGWMVAASVGGELSRQRKAYLDQVEQRAADAERTREETARRRADEERLRIARELHDSLTHSISIIKVQAGVAVHLLRKRDEPVPEALEVIQQASADAMRELRATLEVLRDDPARSASGLDRLGHLTAGARHAGLPVTVSVNGPPRTLPEVVDRAAYRIIQEALTNVTRHAGPATASIQLTYRDSALTVRIDDNGRGEETTALVSGVGLVGMRERVAALGGSLRAGPRPDGGFSVHAELPTVR